jgi:hypothetical protein
MDAWCSEAACTGANGDLPFLEMGEEGIPFFIGRGSIFFAGTGGSPAGDERPVSFDRLGGIDS